MFFLVASQKTLRKDLKPLSDMVTVVTTVAWLNTVAAEWIYRKGPREPLAYHHFATP